jgi:hypothetical protein
METVELDFDGVEVVASPFFNAGIGRLLADLSPDLLNAHLRFAHLSVLADRILRRVIENARDYYAAGPDRRKEIDRVVDETTSAI